LVALVGNRVAARLNRTNKDLGSAKDRLNNLVVEKFRADAQTEAARVEAGAKKEAAEVKAAAEKQIAEVRANADKQIATLNAEADKAREGIVTAQAEAGRANEAAG